MPNSDANMPERLGQECGRENDVIVALRYYYAPNVEFRAERPVRRKETKHRLLVTRFRLTAISFSGFRSIDKGGEWDDKRCEVRV